jgi:flagellar biosynthetic protein FliP
MNVSLELPSQLKVIGFFTLLALVPFVVILMTTFTRISIILTFLRQALSTSIPSNHLIIGLSLILTAYVMHPVITEVYHTSIKTYLESEQKNDQELFENAWPPLRTFMLQYTREKDLALFLDLAKIEIPSNEVIRPSSIPWYCIIPSFLVSELRTAFMMGFLLFLPFLIIDMVVTSLLMSMGMVMLPPVMISFPFKILLFVVVDGWRLVVQQIVVGYT